MLTKIRKYSNMKRAFPTGENNPFSLNVTKLIIFLGGNKLKKYTSMLRKEDTDKKWLEVNAEGIVLGRLATQIAMILMGKTKANYTPHVDNGDFVIVTNAKNIS